VIGKHFNHTLDTQRRYKETHFRKRVIMTMNDQHTTELIPTILVLCEPFLFIPVLYLCDFVILFVHNLIVTLLYYKRITCLTSLANIIVVVINKKCNRHIRQARRFDFFCCIALLTEITTIFYKLLR